MKPYDKLTLRGKVARMRKLACQLLTQYDLAITQVKYLGWFTNLLFKVNTQNNKSYVLRICAPNWRSDLDLISEAKWLDFIHMEGKILAPVPIKSRKGYYLVSDQIDEIPEPRRAMLMSYLPGNPLGKNLNESNLYNMGRLFAKLHQSSLFFRPDSEFTTRKMNTLFSRGEPDVLFSDQNLNCFSGNSFEIFSHIRQKVEAAYQTRYQNKEGLRVIHHDLWHDNIHLYRGQLYPLDFEDTVWGYPIQDIAMAIQDLMDDVPADRFDHLYRAFREGYESILPWPALYETEMDLFRLGRMLWVANYVSRYGHDALKGVIKKQQPMYENFLKTGILRKVDGPV